MRSRWLYAWLMVFALVVSACTSTDPSPQSADSETSAVAVDVEESTEGDLGDAEGEGTRSPAEEVEEESEEAIERVEAYELAIASGEFAQVPTLEGPAPSGWTSVHAVSAKADDWEPAVAADPDDPYVYVLTTRYQVEKGCTTHCRLPFIPVIRSTDGGRTWDKPIPLCSCRNSHGQFDPTIEVVPNTGDVYSAYLTADRKGAFSTVFQKSSNHGRTWSEPVRVYGRVSWTDKPEVTMSANGKHVYVAWNGPQGGDPFVGVSHDFGETWNQIRLGRSKRYYFAYDGTVLPNGTVLFSESGLIYGGQGSNFDRSVHHLAFISNNNGRTWHRSAVDTVQRGIPCIADGCSDDFYLGQTSVANDSTGHLVFAYEGATDEGEPQRIYIRTSDDDGETWAAQRILSPADENATGPRIDSIGNGDVRIWYNQTSDGDPDAWNVWYRDSSDGGKTWSRPVRLSTATSGAGYLSPQGFAEIYGDYGEIAITNDRRTIATWGAGFDYIGPGNTWVAVQ